ncbi:MAG: hypothetical protein MJB57_03830, partial [Gemmatimonadetes bacterium]|nr:hypothetical protein [Gemmatimonadota bacterium]
MNPPDVAVKGDVSAPTRATTDGEARMTTIRPEGLREPKLTENAKTVLARRYLKKDESGEPIAESTDL